MQEFGLQHLSAWDLEHAFIEFRPQAGKCKFNDCRHRGEPGCAIEAACERGEINRRRLQIFGKLMTEITQAKKY